MYIARSSELTCTPASKHSNTACKICISRVVKSDGIVITLMDVKFLMISVESKVKNDRV